MYLSSWWSELQRAICFYFFLFFNKLDKVSTNKSTSGHTYFWWPAIKRQRIWRPFILHDNVRTHIHSEVRASISRRLWKQFEHPPCSPDLNQCDFDSIMRIKRPLKGNRYSGERELIIAVDGIIRLINIYEEVRGILRLPDQWKYVANRNGQCCLDI